MALFYWCLIIPVVADNATEGRITEHSVVSIVALSGLLLIAHIARKRRKSEFQTQN